MRPSLRHRLLTVALLSVISCAVSLTALARVLSLTSAQRLERAQDAVAQELAELSRPSVTPAAPATLLGMHGGHLAGPCINGLPCRGPCIKGLPCRGPCINGLPCRGPCINGLPCRGPLAFEEALPADLDTPTKDALVRAIRDAEATRAAVVRPVDEAESILVVGAAPAASGAFAWVSYAARPPSFVWIWRLIVASLTIATALLVLTALSAVVSVRRGAAALKASLAALVTDLSAPVRRPAVRELSDVADGIAALAQALARAQGDKERLTEELAQRERLAALGRVAAGIAHEVRNPLASIKLRVDLGRQRPGVPPQLARELGSVSEEVTRLDRLVADLLIVAGRRSGPRAATELGALARRRAGLLAPWAEERGVTIRSSGDATVSLDVDAVSRALDNLVRNAVEASPRGAEVTIAILDDPSGARVEVLDHGGGVDRARLPELFEPFFTTKPEGTGLGLALSRAIAAAHGGALTYERRDRTTCFELSFPAAARPPRTTSATSASSPSSIEARG